MMNPFHPMKKTFVLEAISIACPWVNAFDYVSDRSALPTWTKAFKNVTPTGAAYETPVGIVQIGLEVIANRDTGVVDWIMKFPDGNVERAHARVIAEDANRTNVQFFLAPKLPPEVLAEIVEKYSAIIREELDLLKAALEHPATKSRPA